MATDKDSRTKTKAKVSMPKGFGPMVTLLLFSTAMLVLPLLTYFSIRKFIINSTTYGAMGAIVMVQVIVALYIYKAWSDENREHQAQMKDKNEQHRKQHLKNIIGLKQDKKRV